MFIDCLILSNVNGFQALWITFIRNYSYFMCSIVFSQVFLCIPILWICIQICLCWTLFFNTVQSFAFARLIYFVRSQCNILKTTWMAYYLYFDYMNRQFKSILCIIWSLLFGFWISYFIENLINFLLRNWRINFG